MKSPSFNWPSETKYVPAKKLLNVGWTARATAKPPIPNPANRGLIAIFNWSSAINVATA